MHKATCCSGFYTYMVAWNGAIQWSLGGFNEGQSLVFTNFGSPLWRLGQFWIPFHFRAIIGGARIITGMFDTQPILGMINIHTFYSYLFSNTEPSVCWLPKEFQRLWDPDHVWGTGSLRWPGTQQNADGVQIKQTVRNEIQWRREPSQ